jgi:hypothetical protein
MDLSPIKDAKDLVARILQMGGPNDADAKLGFDMGRGWYDRKRSKHPCGAACCIGGLVEACNGEERAEFMAFFVSEVTGFSLEQCDLLCYPWEKWGRWCGVENATPAQGAAAVQIMIENGGICDWPAALIRGATMLDFCNKELAK